MKMEVIYKNETIVFTHIVKKGLKHAYISLDNNNDVILKSRLIPAYKAKEIVIRKAPWILNKLKHIREKQKIEFSTGKTIPFLGNNYVIDIIEDITSRNVSIRFSESIFKIKLNPLLNQREIIIEKCLGEFYRTEAQKKIINRVICWSKVMNLFPFEVKFRKLKRRWGSCSPDDIVIFNYNIMKLPYEFIDYIIVHELSHIKEKNHSRRFWDLVSEFIPDCKTIHKKILNFVQ